MAKFIIECPRCGKYTEASTGIFSKRQLPCSCGYTIDTKVDKIASRICPSCGNHVAYDQSKGDKAKCPVCKNPISTLKDKSKTVDFTCPSCNCHLNADKHAATYTCPLCDEKIDVRARLAKEEAREKGVVSVIKYEGDNKTFVWKHPLEDFNLGSQLIVHESQEAIFFRDGKALDLFGSGRHMLETQSLPLLEKLYKLPTGTDNVFHSEVYFINMTTQMGIKWGTDSKVRLRDPESGIYVEIGACGSFNLRVSDSRRLLLKLVGTTAELTQGDVLGTEGFGNSYMLGKFRSLIMNKVKSNIPQAIKECNINILEIDSYIDALSDRLRNILNTVMEDYGLYIPEFFITNVMLPEDDPNFRRLRQQFAEKTLRVREEEVLRAEAEAAQARKLLEAETEAKLKVVAAQGEAEAQLRLAQAQAEGYRAQAMAEADEMKAKGYTYAQETARQVGLEAMQNGITGGEGGNGGGIMGSLGDMASLGVSLGAMGSVIGMTKEALNPMMSSATGIGNSIFASADAGTAPVGAAWNCTACGQSNIFTPFCPSCGAKKPAENTPDTWDCACGAKGITSRFCPNCGTKKPEAAEGWDCACGQKNVTTKFCPNCGSKKPETAEGWDCTCGQKNILFKFCPECGAKKPEAPETWDCECGQKNIVFKFCPECGKRKGE